MPLAKEYPTWQTMDALLLNHHDNAWDRIVEHFDIHLTPPSLIPKLLAARSRSVCTYVYIATDDEYHYVVF